ncbi:MAG: hypothetical protein ACXV3S_11235 [Kineosporiaceae bacterium]
MTAARRPRQARRPTGDRVPGSRSAGRPGGGLPLARAQPIAQPPPLERRQARRMLVGLAAFAGGFAAAAGLVTAGLGGTPAYWILVSLGLLGIGFTGFSSPRGPLEGGRPPVWSRRGLAGVSEAVGLPARAVTITFYALLAVGVLGNLVLPVLVRRR